LLQNKDNINILLNIEQIPTPKDFQDSLSAEQQEFTKAYRKVVQESGDL